MATDRKPFRVSCDRVSKRFGRQWVLRHFSLSLTGGTVHGIRGRNGSGKTTVLRLLSGQLSPSRGRVLHSHGGKPLSPNEVYRYVSWSGPYTEVVEELSIREFLRFHFSLKSPVNGLTVEQMIERTGLTAVRDRALADCSSGMRQRILLASVLYADTPLLLLDEPTVTFDGAASEWFHDELGQFCRSRLVVIASNDERDLRSCESVTTL